MALSETEELELLQLQKRQRERAATKQEEPQVEDPVIASPLETGLLHATNPLGMGKTMMGVGEGINEAASAIPETLRERGWTKESLDYLMKKYQQGHETGQEAYNVATRNNPKSAFAGDIGNAVWTAALIPGSANPAALGMGMGGAYGFGNSDADITKPGGAGQLLSDTSGSAALAGIAGKALPYVAKPLGKAGKWAGQKFMNSFMDVSEPASERYITNPGAVHAATTEFQNANNLAKAVGEVRNDSGPAAEAFLSTLSKERVPLTGLEADKNIKILRSFNDPATQKLADRLEAEYMARAPGMGAESRPTTISRKMQFVPKSPSTPFPEGNLSVDNVANNNGGLFEPSIRNEKLYTTPNRTPPFQTDARTGFPVKKLVSNRIEGIPETLQESKYLTEREAHDVKHALQQAAGNYKNAMPTYEMAKARLAGSDVDNILKSDNMDYKTAIGDSSSNLNLKENLITKFGIIADPKSEGGFQPTNQTLMAMKKAIRGNEFERGNTLADLKTQGYGDIAENIKNTEVKNLLYGEGRPNGARKAAMGASIGTGIGGSIGGYFGGTHGAVIGGGIGGSIGGFAGGVADKYGPQMARVGMDAARKLPPSNALMPGIAKAASVITSRGPQATSVQPKEVVLQKLRGTVWEGPLRAAAQRGDNAWGVTYGLLYKNPEFRKAIEEPESAQ